MEGNIFPMFFRWDPIDFPSLSKNTNKTRGGFRGAGGAPLL